MRKGGSSKVKEAIFRASTKGKEVQEAKGSEYISEEDEVNFVKKLQLGTGRLEVSFLSNVLIVEELVIMLLSVLIKKHIKGGRK